MWTHPLPGSRLSPGRHFVGPHPAHSGMDLIYSGGSCGRRVLAARAGTARRAEDRGGGHGVWIDHGDGSQTGYWHLGSRLVRTGQRVAAGQAIGLAGASGTMVRGCNLHLELKVNGRYVDPAPLTGGVAIAVPEGNPGSFPATPGSACPPGYVLGRIDPRFHGWLPGTPWWNRPVDDDGTALACIRQGLKPGDNTALADATQGLTAAALPVVANVGLIVVALVVGWTGVKQVIGVR